MPESLFRLAGREETLWSDAPRRLRLLATREPPPDLVELLGRIPFGSEGIRYRRLGVEEQLARLKDAVFLRLLREDRLVGVYALSAGRLEFGDVGFSGVYRGPLGVEPDMQGTGLGREIVTRTLAWLERQALESGRPTVSYGCIEQSNVRSLALLRSLGARELGSLRTLSVYRQWPRRRIGVERLGDGDRAAVRLAVASMRRDCGLRAAAGAAGEYFAVTDSAGVVVGAAASVTRIDFQRIGGPWDWLSRTLFRMVPAARRRFDPRDFAYLRLDDVVARPGHEHLWPDFLSTLLAEHRIHMAMFALDPRAELTARLAGAGLFGRVTAALQQEVAVLASGWNLNRISLDAMARKPLGLGPPDL